ncbi:hypothetical protein [Galbibacter mesophilus]|uniref:hypothetical protein n=1 Tax=Galbibacter mesophilus TaxID=379069 RepID=UPI00191E2421|nr:hypothetical protein [Galbibacter mesophilus]MCM5663112.1 hypothetical protein [Galbibacter mesophilus]
MKKKDNIEELFEKLEGQWDNEVPNTGHENRFLEKLEANKNNKHTIKKNGSNKWVWLSIAASVVVLMIVGIQFFKSPTDAVNAIAEEPTEVQKTQFYFASIISEEMEKIEAESTPETKKIVSDAMLQIQKLEKDYKKLEEDLANDGNSKKILHAMIINFQTRISLLEDVLDQIEEVKNLNTSNNENQII